MKLVILAAIVAFAYGQEGCGDWGEYSSQTDCLWFPLKNLRQNMMDSCGIDFDVDQLPTPPPLPAGMLEEMPEKCGHCSFKYQCRKRDFKDGCFPFDGKAEHCHDHGDVCVMPKVPKLNNCKWNFYSSMLKQCINRPESDLPEWKRQAMQKAMEVLPDGNCIEKDGKCHCCCHPYKPNADGSACEEVPDQGCQPWGEFNEWSECMWGMPQDIIGKFRDHCSINVKRSEEITKGIQLPEGFSMPEKCGFCSFKVRCRKRDRTDKNGQPRCFPVESEKRACGAEDCPTCTTPCELPKIRDSCDYGSHVQKFLKAKFTKIEKMPYWRKRGMYGIAKNLPYAKCVDVDGKCMCCCHPYEPNEAGTECTLKGYCKLPSDLGINIFQQK